MRHCLALLLTCALAVPGLGTAAPPKGAAAPPLEALWEEAALPASGVPLAIVRDPRAGAVAFRISFRTDELNRTRADRAALLLAAELLMEGSAFLTPRESAENLASLGASLDMDAGVTGVVLVGHCPSASLGPVLEHLVHRFQHPSVIPTRISAARTALARRAQAVDLDPLLKARQLVRERIQGGGLLDCHVAKAFDAATPQTIAAVQAALWSPARARIQVVGPDAPEALRGLLDRATALWKPLPPRAAAPATTSEPALDAGGRCLASSPGLDHLVLSAGLPVGPKASIAALALAARVLDWAMAGDPALASARPKVDWEAGGGGRPGVLGVSLQALPVSAAGQLAALERHLKAFCTARLDPAAFDTARRGLAGERRLHRDHPLLPHERSADGETGDPAPIPGTMEALMRDLGIGEAARARVVVLGDEAHLKAGAFQAGPCGPPLR